MKVSELQIQKNFQSLNSGGINSIRKGNNVPGHSSFKIDKHETGIQNFSDILENKINPEKEITFSAHAKRRIADRNIKVDLVRLENGINQVQKKGAKNSLVMIDDDAYIVNVKKKTVVTAVDQHSIKNNVFTNIDSVAIV